MRVVKTVVLFALVFPFQVFCGEPSLPGGFNSTSLPKVTFKENKGQVSDQNYKPRPDVLFSGTDGKMTYHLKPGGISYQLYRVDSCNEKYTGVLPTENSIQKPKLPNKVTVYRVDVNWIAINPNYTIVKGKEIAGYENYYLEQCSSDATQIKTYQDITFVNIYHGINLHYYEKDGILKYDYIVTKNTDYKQIQLEIKGAQLRLQRDGSLLIKTPLGIIKEEKPTVFQRGKTLKSKWKIKNNIISFEIENYNPSQELIIDPPTRLWGTYYGGAQSDEGRSTVIDGSGNVYLSGFTQSNTSTVIATSGSYQTTFAGSWDAYLVKFDQNGIRQWGTYFGGIGGDFIYSSATDATGNIYVTGITGSTSSTVIATTGSHQDIYGGGGTDAFLIKFSTAGIRLWGTYYGGTGDDDGNSCAVDPSGNVCLMGRTFSSTGTAIATSSSHQNLYGGGTYDAFLVKFNSSGVRQWGTYYGGTGQDDASSCAIDASGNIFISGSTQSIGGIEIASPSSHQDVYGGGPWDAFLAKFDPTGVRQWGTYYGGTSNELGLSCSADGTGNIYLSGNTQSSNGTVIATSSSHQSTYGGGNDAFLVKFNTGGIRQWGSYYGGIGNESGQAIVADNSGNTFLAGNTSTNTGTVIVTAGSYQTTFGGVGDGFLIKFDFAGIRQWGTYYGGTGTEEGLAVCTNGSGTLYLGGRTTSSNGTSIATAASHQSVYGGGGFRDAFLVKFIECAALGQPGLINGPTSVCEGSSSTFSIVPVGGATSYSWSIPGGWNGSSTSNTISITVSNNSGSISVVASNACGASSASTLNINVNLQPTITVNSGSVCSGQSFTMIPSGASTYTFSGGSSIVTPTTNTSYTVTGTSSAGCTNTTGAVSNIAVSPLPNVTVSTSNSLICGPPFQQTATITANGANTYTWSTSANGSSITVSPSVTTSYTVNGTDANGCSNSFVFTQSVSTCANITGYSFSNSEPIIYPNPNNGEFIISLSNIQENILLEVYNGFGQIIMRKPLLEANTKISLSEQANGIYFVRVIGENTNYYSKIIKE